jgi:hypothetical protein
VSDPYLTDWNPREYLRTYYSGPVYDDDRFIFTAAAAWVKTCGRRFDRCLEVGCGPTVHHAIPFVPVVGEFHMSDFVPANLDEVRKWRDRAAGAHDWSRFVREAVSIEGADASDGGVNQREDELRQKLTALRACDLRQPAPLGETATYDLVLSFFTAECAATNSEHWRAVMRHLLGLVRPGGSVFMASILNCERYDILGRWFQTAAVSVADVSAALAENGFPESGTVIQAASTQDMIDHGFAGIYLVSATKAGHG